MKSQTHARGLWRLALAFCLTLAGRPAHAFDYLEHSYFSDRACREAQIRIGGVLAAEPHNAKLRAKYLALALVCPQTWDKAYCANGYKQAEGTLNVLDEPSPLSGEQSITLGDFAALPDHLSRFGPVKGLPRAEEQGGLVEKVFQWTTADPGDAGGVIADVAEDACESDEPVDWNTVDRDIEVYMQSLDRADPPAIPDTYMSPLDRMALNRGPRDRAGAYSFDNPHFLDLVLRDHHHFGNYAYEAWLDFHSTASDLSARSCESILHFADDTLEEFEQATGVTQVTAWDDLPADVRQAKGCDVLAMLVRQRLLRWADAAGDAQLAPVAEVIETLPKPTGESMQNELHAVVSALISLVFEGTGLHYLQDGLSAGHMRTIKTRRGLAELRYDHDLDNRDGVIAVLRTASGAFPLVAFGDSYLLGKTEPQGSLCDWKQERLPPRVVSACLVQHQRGVVVAAVTASLLDWALGERFDGQHCDGVALSGNARFICRTLPVVATRAPGHLSPEEVADIAQPLSLPVSPAHIPGSLPVPPPPFEYEALIFNVALDVAGSANQFALNFTSSKEMGEFAQWLQGYRVGILATLGQSERSQFILEGAYRFNWRWAARMQVDMGPMYFMGFRGVGTGDRTYFSGIGPTAGVTMLPEGWTKIPLAMTLEYRLPLTMFTSRHGFFGDSFGVEAHWLQFGVGLAFM